MRRKNRESRDSFKYILYLSTGALAVTIITFIITFLIYNNKINKSSYSMLATEKIADLVPNAEETESASLAIGKSVEEQQTTETEINTLLNNAEEEKKEVVIQEVVEEKIPEPLVIPDPKFIMPVDGEINRGYAKDTLIYSETLQEWITHMGIDILSDKTTVVKASADGIVTNIKNDPRYGLTVIIEHANNFKTVYSNLLTAEFINEGEQVVSGQTIGTVGTSATFEILDAPHLHFEITKNGENLDPTLYVY